MKHAYLIMAHHEPELLKLLIERLDDVNHALYIHLDKKSKMNVDEFSGVAKNALVHFIEQKSIYWGGYSQIRCEIDLLEAAVKSEYDYYHLITGVDLPLKSNEEIDAFFYENKGMEFISFDKAANEKKNFAARYDRYHFFVRYAGKNVVLQKSCTMLNFLLACVTKALNLCLGNRSKKYDDLMFMKGSAYFDITHALAEYIVAQKDRIRTVFRFTKCCDEVFVHTIAYNSTFRQKISPLKTRFIDWRKHGYSPEVLTMEHYESIRTSECLFARKFSSVESKELMENLFFK